MGLPTKEDLEAAGTVWADDGEWGSSESEDVPATGFWDTPAQAKKDKKKPTKKALKKEKKEKKKQRQKKTRRRNKTVLRLVKAPTRHHPRAQFLA